jgi:hypothetical protein
VSATKTFNLIRLIIGQLVMAAIFTACAPTYDNVADQMLVNTQEQADHGLLRLENLGNEIANFSRSPNLCDQNTIAEAEAEASYASNIDFYSKLQSSVTLLAERMTSNPDLSTNKIASSLGNLEKNIDSTRRVHATENTLAPDFAMEMRQTLDQQFKVLTVYELTIKNGTKPR